MNDKSTLTPWQQVLYALVYGFIYVVSLLPMWIHYRFSDFLYFLVYHVVRYRRKLVRRNLADSFPEKSADEILRIERRYYAWFCDYIVETLKLTSISQAEMQRRMRFFGLEQIEEAMRRGDSSTCYLGHYCNWEWVSSIGLNYSDNIRTGQIYHELESPVMNRFFLKIRGRFKGHSIRMNQTLQTLIAWRREGIISCTGYIADQVPGFHDMHCWPMFLNHDTPVYTGTERMARILGGPVFYLDLSRPRRGYYECRVVKITDDIKLMPNFQPTLRYFELFEQTIRRDPAFWLWSHNRWKRTRQDFINAIPDEQQRQRILSRP